MIDILKEKRAELETALANQIITAEAMEAIDQKVAEYRKELLSVLEKKVEEERAFIGVKLSLLDELINKHAEKVNATSECDRSECDRAETTEAVTGF